LDPLGYIGLDKLHLIPWVAGAAFALVAGLVRPRMFHWTALGSVMLFAALNVGAGIYVLNHVGDPRWAGGQAALNAPSFSETPVVGKFLGPLDSALSSVVGGVNEFLNFKQALPVALDFLAASGWALLVAFPLAVLAAVVSFTIARRRAADFDRYRAAVDQLRTELDQVKEQLALDSSVRAAGPLPQLPPRMKMGGTQTATKESAP